MMQQHTFRRWSSNALPAAYAAEFVASPVMPADMAGALAVLAAAPADAAFVTVRLGPGDRAGLRRAITAVNRADVAPRICLAVDAGQLALIDAAALDGCRVGLLLDDVDAETSLADVARDAIEAVRFRADFVTRAANQLRLGCVLDAMLGLTSNLGLCTLGPRVLARNVLASPAAEFDYSPTPVQPPLPPDRVRSSRRRAHASVHSALHFTR